MALIPPFFLDCVVAIGIANPSGEKQWIASGFLFGEYSHTTDSGEKQYHVYLVTNRHVVSGKEEVWVRFNPISAEPSREYRLPIRGESGLSFWGFHPDPDVDVAVIHLNAPLLREHGMQFQWFHSDEHVATIEKMLELELTEGDPGYVLGFPMGLVGGERTFVVARHATVARIRDALSRTTKEFLMDTFIFPGNSGGPVVTRPELMSITGTKSQGSAYLIGMVKAFVPYNEIAVSPQTGLTRVMFQENSGLAAIVPIDFVVETIDALKRDQRENVV